MAGPVIRVEGVSRLVRTMKAAEVDLDDLKDVQAEAGRIALEHIEREMPVRSGRLRGSARSNRAARRSTVSVGGASVPYAAVIHWGWPARHIEPNEYGTRGLEAAEPRIHEVFVDGIERILSSVQGA